MSDLTVEQQQTAIRMKKIQDNAIVLSNVVELATSVIVRIAGKDIADSVTNQTLSRSVLTNLVANRVKDQILNKGQ